MPIGQPADSCVKRCEIIIQFISALSLFELKRQGSYWSIMVKFLSLLPLREGVCCPQGIEVLGLLKKRNIFLFCWKFPLPLQSLRERGVLKKDNPTIFVVQVYRPKRDAAAIKFFKQMIM